MDGNEAITVYGLGGNFAGDDDLVARLQSMRAALASRSPEMPPLKELVALMDSVPLRTRMNFIKKCILQSNHRDAIVKALFDYCFMQDGDIGTQGSNSSLSDYEEVDEFLLIGITDTTERSAVEGHAPMPLNLNKYHIFHVVIVLMASSGALGAELSLRYLNESSSTKYRAKILIQSIGCYSPEDFSDDELWRQYQLSARSVQDKIVEACKKAKKNRQRKVFLRRVYEQDPTRHQELFFWLDAKYLESHLGDLFRSGTMKYWGRFGDIYVSFIGQKLDQCGNDKLRMGEVWSHVTKSCLDLKSAQPHHIHALIAIWKDRNPLLIKASTRSEIRQHLCDISKSGKDVSGFTKEVGRCGLTKEILRKLSVGERLALATEFFQADDWNRFEMICNNSSMPRHKLPYKEALAKFVARDFQASDSRDPFLAYFFHANLYVYAGAEQREILLCWSNLFLRFKPSQVEFNHFGSTFADAWQNWLNQYFEKILLGMPEISCDPCRESNLTEAYAQRVDLALRLLLDAYHLAAAQLPSNALRIVLQALKRVPYRQLSKSSVISIRKIVVRCEEIVIDSIIPVLKDSIHFDPRNANKYVSTNSIRFFYNSISDLFNSWKEAIPMAILEVVSYAIVDMADRASKPLGRRKFVVVEVPSNKESQYSQTTQKFKYYDFDLHGHALQRCQELAKITLVESNRVEEVSGGNSTMDPTLLEKLWTLISKQATKLDELEMGEYFNCVHTCLSKNLFEKEKPNMINRSRALIMATCKRSPHCWKREIAQVAKSLSSLGLLEEALGHNSVPEKVRISLLVEHAGFANEHAQKFLENATFESDGQARADAITNLLAAACKTDSACLIAKALKFAEGRIKNEAKPQRTIVFSWLESHFVADFVVKTLAKATSDFDSIQEISSSIVAILRNDLNRLDSIGRQHCFPTLPATIMDTAMHFDPSILNTNTRQLWFSCAILLDWELLVASGGSKKFFCYRWPIQRKMQRFDHRLESARWIRKSSYDKLYSLGATKSSKRRTAAEYIRVDFDKDSTFGPTQCVHMLLKALKDVWADDISVPALLEEGQFPENEDAASSLLARTKLLFDLSGPVWPEVHVLEKIFDNIFANIAIASETHFCNAYLLLLGLIETESSCPKTPCIREAIDQVFRRAVRDQHEDIARCLFPKWLQSELRFHLEEWVWDDDVDVRMKAFHYEHVIEYRPQCCQKIIRSETESVSIKLGLARNLLCMSTSTLYLPFVRHALFDWRQDIIANYSNLKDPVEGIFCEGDNGSIESALFDYVSKEQLLGCSAEVSRHYAEYMMQKATDSDISLKGRIEAIAGYVAAPSMQTTDVLPSLQAHMDPAVHESLISKIFSLDSPWHILGFMLSQKNIEKHDQRITATLLGCVVRHVHVDKVVRLLGILLKKERRKKLGLQLHKAVIRMLFDAKTDLSTELLRREWDSKDLHESNQVLIVELCLEQVINGNVGGWESSVLIDVASKNVAVEMKLRLFEPTLRESPSLWPTFTMQVAPPSRVEENDLLELYRSRMQAKWFSSQNVAIFMQSIMEELYASSSSCPTIRSLAKIKQFYLSIQLFGQREQLENLSVLEKMRDSITKPLDVINHRVQVEQKLLSELFATGAMRVIEREVSWRPGITEEEVKKKITDFKGAAILRDQFGEFLEAALDLPIKRDLHLGVYLESLKGIMRQCNPNSDHDGLTVVSKTIFHPFSNQIQLLQQHSTRIGAVTSALGSAGLVNEYETFDEDSDDISGEELFDTDSEY